MDEKVAQYIAAIPAEKRPLFDRLQRLILDLYPDLELRISYGIVMHKRGKSWVGLGVWKQGVSLYTNRPQLITAFKTRHPAIKTGKGCINFRLTDELPVEDLHTVITGAVEPAGA